MSTQSCTRYSLKWIAMEMMRHHRNLRMPAPVILGSRPWVWNNNQLDCLYPENFELTAVDNFLAKLADNFAGEFVGSSADSFAEESADSFVEALAGSFVEESVDNSSAEELADSIVDCLFLMADSKSYFVLDFHLECERKLRIDLNMRFGRYLAVRRFLVLRNRIVDFELEQRIGFAGLEQSIGFFEQEQNTVLIELVVDSMDMVGMFDVAPELVVDSMDMFQSELNMDI